MALPTVDSITISGFKSIYDPQTIELRPLTILAGANSSGKSSIIQPLLLLKQTLEWPSDPGAVLLNGPNVAFTSTDQFFSRITGNQLPRDLQIKFSGGTGASPWQYGLTFSKRSGHRHGPLTLKVRMRRVTDDQDVTLSEGMGDHEVRQALGDSARHGALGEMLKSHNAEVAWSVVRERCFLRPVGSVSPDPDMRSFVITARHDEVPVSTFLRGLLHLPGLRGNALRTYRTSAVESDFPGLFQEYVASVIMHWQRSDRRRRDRIDQILKDLGLTWKVRAKQLNDAQVELRVGRLPRAAQGGAQDLVSIADVGVGVSQVLPVVVALLAAGKGQTVYLEQPEIHLHPKAQLALAKLFADAVKRGVRVIAETHSDLLLLGVQTLVAEGSVGADQVGLHWFDRDVTGRTEVRRIDMDAKGTSADWRVDFGEVTMDAQRRYLDAQW